MILSCAIIDDEPLAAELLASYVSKTPGLRLAGVYESAVTAMKELRERPVDLLFLDIQMPELSGLEFATLLPKDTRIIFTTAFDRYAIDGYKVNAVDYLLKPISYKDFLEAAGRVLERFPSPSAPVRSSFFVKSEYRYIQIYFDEILYIEGMKDYVKIYLSGSREPVLSLMGMKTVESRLPSGDFIRIHRSFIVRKDKIRAIERGGVIVRGATSSAEGRRIPVGESYREQLQSLL